MARRQAGARHVVGDEDRDGARVLCVLYLHDEGADAAIDKGDLPRHA